VELAGLAAALDNPIYVAADPQEQYLYVAHDLPGSGDSPPGALSAFAITPETGELTFLNRQPSLGMTPCYVTVDRTGRYAFVANFRGTHGGCLSMLPIKEGGELGEAADFIEHQGAGAHPTRQAGPHVHSVTLDPGNRFAFVADLGIDRVMIYRLDLAAGKLIPGEQPWAQVSAGAGPRHFAFHPSRRYVYLINEIDSTMTAFAYDEKRGALRELQSLSTLPAGFEGDNSCADVHLAPSGRFVYGSNRGHDSIVVFAIDSETGLLSYVEHLSTQGRTPRGFAIDPTGRLLLAANQDSHTLVSFWIDGETGRLSPTGQMARVPSPVCVQMIATFPALD
jgi:6-phosphogluconolactonase